MYINLKLLSKILVINVILLSVFVEIAGAVFYYLNYRTFLYTSNASDKEYIAAPLQVAQAVFQPYFGYTLKIGREGDFQGRKWKTNNFGFQFLADNENNYPCCEYPYKRKGNEVIVGVFGGSVADGFVLEEFVSNGFSKALRDANIAKNRPIQILNFSLPGWRQPQQLTALAYFLSIGQEFDLVINLDGFNEVVTSYKNWESGVEPNYPADTLWGAWGRNLELSNAANQTSAQLLKKYHLTASKKADYIEEHSKFGSQFLWRFFKKHYHSWMASRIEDSRQEVSQASKWSYFPTAYFTNLGSDFDIYTYTANLWAQSSIAMSGLAERFGFSYLHVLQPNQWFKENGPYLAQDHQHPFKWVINPVNQGYQQLGINASTLQSEKVHFFDSNPFFKGLGNSTYYSDDCCHLTPEGNKILFAVIAQKVANLNLVE